jgi:carboxyl-terminal processing protease
MLAPCTRATYSTRKITCNVSTSDSQAFDAVEVFDVCWQTFTEHYAFSNQINWHWQKQYKAFRAKVSDSTTPEALVVIIKDLMGHINDGHAFLYDADGEFLAYVNLKDTVLNNRIRSSFKAQSEITSFRAFFSKTVNLTNKTTAQYFDSKYQAKMLEGNFWLAKLPNNYSYLHIEDMSGFGREEDNLAADLDAVDRAMKTIIPVLNSSKGLVLDLRWNGGGEDLVSMRILSYFIDKPLVASRKYAKLTKGFSLARDIVV